MAPGLHMRKLRHRVWASSQPVRAVARALIQYSSEERRHQDVEVATGWQKHGRVPGEAQS